MHKAHAIRLLTSLAFVLYLCGCKPVEKKFTVSESGDHLIITHEGHQIVDVGVSVNMYFVTVQADGVPIAVIDVEKWKKEPNSVMGILQDRNGDPHAVEMNIKQEKNKFK